MRSVHDFRRSYAVKYFRECDAAKLRFLRRGGSFRLFVRGVDRTGLWRPFLDGREAADVSRTRQARLKALWRAYRPVADRDGDFLCRRGMGAQARSA